MGYNYSMHGKSKQQQAIVKQREKQEEIIKENRERLRKKEFDMYLISQSKGYICAYCAPDELEMSKIDYKTRYTAEVTLKCPKCNHSQVIEISNFDI
ncbi:hypothetical protein [Bacillus cereus]|uniref:Uncharacterized protein n=1 Tax=Bacillus cereus TaxID=1396 RepID=A0A1S9V0X3_BACCE|nr:hypothetical protein [Bacillus cereus]MEB9998652.1 hypothetical protein [Bacillus cereus]OOR28116.1 hypothetical protein BW892_10220 [Bacillus cereus]